MTDERLSELEVKCAYLEKTLNDLSEVVWRQQRELDTLRESQRQLKERVDADPGLVDASRQDRPPHY